jgi:hypothetical protein
LRTDAGRVLTRASVDNGINKDLSIGSRLRRRIVEAEKIA